MKTRPNILLILTDQQRHDTIAALGNDCIRTPVLDRLAREGSSFDYCYTPSPVCVAARCSLMTGLPPHRTGCVNNGPMPQHIASFVEHLADSGYRTHGVGKMHFTPDHTRMWGFQTRDISEELQEFNDDYRSFLKANGFEHVDECHGLRSEYYYIPQPSQLPAKLHHTAWVADCAIEFLRNRKKEQPFFLMASFLKPHPPFESPTPWNRLYRAADMCLPVGLDQKPAFRGYWNELQNRFKYRAGGDDRMLMRTIRAAYYGCISFVDFHMGRILRELAQAIDDTLVVFTSDHGELLGDYGCYGKRTMHEASARIPLLARWPAAFAAGERVKTPASLLDLFPTFLSASGLASGAGLEGVPLWDLKKKKSGDRAVFSQFESGALGQYLAGDGIFKYAYSAPDQAEWLVNLEADPVEMRNLVDDCSSAEIRNLFRQLLRNRYSKDGCEGVFDDFGWQPYPSVTLPEDSNENLIFQEPASVNRRLKSLDSEYIDAIRDIENSKNL